MHHFVCSVLLTIRALDSRLYCSPSLTGRARSSEEALNVLLCLGRGELSSSTRGLDGVGLFPFAKIRHPLGGM